MTVAKDSLTEAEEILKGQFKEGTFMGIPSDARDRPGTARFDQLILPDEQRGRMPFTKDKYIVRENPQLVQWERECRKFLRRLSLDHGHRISATMIYEWVTGIPVVKLQEQGGSANADLKQITRILKHYFGKPYTTYIMNKKVARAYRVRPGYRIKRHRPMTMELYAEYVEGTLNP